MDYKLSEEPGVKVGMHEGSVFPSFFSSAVVDVVSGLAREGVLSELLCVFNMVLMSETTEGLGSKFRKWREAFESKALIDNIEETTE